MCVCVFEAQLGKLLNIFLEIKARTQKAVLEVSTLFRLLDKKLDIMVLDHRISLWVWDML